MVNITKRKACFSSNFLGQVFAGDVGATFTCPTGTRNNGLVGFGEVAVRQMQLEPLGGQRIEKESVSRVCSVRTDVL